MEGNTQGVCFGAVTFRLSEHAAPEQEGLRLASNDSRLRKTINDLGSATVIGLSLMLQCSNIRTHEPASVAPVSNNLADIPDGESLLGRTLIVTREGEEPISFLIHRQKGEIVFSIGEDTFRSGNTVPIVGKVSEQISDVTTEGNNCVRLHSKEHGYVDVPQHNVCELARQLAAAPKMANTVNVQAIANYEPPAGSAIAQAHSFLRTTGMIETTDDGYTVHNITFRRDRPVHIAQNSK